MVSFRAAGGVFAAIMLIMYICSKHVGPGVSVGRTVVIECLLYGFLLLSVYSSCMRERATVLLMDSICAAVVVATMPQGISTQTEQPTLPFLMLCYWNCLLLGT
ncbi:uncharacterized protein TM35_000133210 [Trypanosoma theileri]|uniref:Uncharacterized protein n=1 Tax=Trypanosoma theileri TaxID=67003 RepID=A0A1X0NX82_9TRYP|nr:uncharacterized protein TM35_000133210 [Trypanosoma theileri]ORC89317.1 hypothetical protein TM35_000133210 [Trypanosoma theileri]